MNQNKKSRRWRDGVIGVTLITLISAYYFDLFEREPYPVIRSELQVEDTNDAFTNPRFRWLDNDHIVVLVGERPDPRPRGRRRMIHAMKVWDIRGNDVRTLVGGDVDALCLVDGYFRIMVRRDGPGGTEVLEFYAGREANLQKVPPGRYDDMSCRPFSEVPLPEWTQSVRDPKLDIRRLRPEHGFLAINRDYLDGPTQSIVLHRTDGKSSNVSAILGSEPVKHPYVQPRYFAFKNAYLMHATGLWLHPSGRVVQDTAFPSKSVAIDRSLVGHYPIPTTRFPLFGATTLEPGYIERQGLYELAEPNRPRRLVKGRIAQELEVSPDGCKVAYANDERIHIDRDAPRHIYKLQIITLCPEKQP